MKIEVPENQSDVLEPMSEFFAFDLFGVKGLGVKAIVSIVIILLNYVFSKWIVFKKDVG